MLNNLVSVLVPVFLASAMSGCGHIETNKSSDILAGNIAARADTAAPRCDTRYMMEDGKEEMPYAERLRLVLNLATPKQLETLEKHNVKVCLDQRHALTDRGFLGGTFTNTFYPASAGRGPVIGLYDDGHEPRDFHHTEKFMALIAAMLENGSVAKEPLHMNVRYAHCNMHGEESFGGKIPCTKYSLRPLSGSALLEKHPEMVRPPIQTLP